VKDRIKYLYKSVSETTETDLFSSNVPERKIRYVLKIILTGNGSVSETVTISKKKEDGTYDVFIAGINLAPPEYKEIPQGSIDLENPLLVLEGGTNLAAKTAGGNAVNITVIYYDNDI